ncbi:hypothetical protein [Palleronia rufa]|uniref:hypothetical protein n=1 Tax=Palleronia rufa TaxID=1530186 RepID=UPI00126970AD|nr:hypothetical protein [Palleronia rufa]
MSSLNHPAINPGTVASSGSGVMWRQSRSGVVTDASAIPLLRRPFTGVQQGFRADLAAEDAGVPGAVGRAVVGEHLDGIWRLAGREPSLDRIMSRMSDAGIHHGPPKDDLAVERLNAFGFPACLPACIAEAVDVAASDRVARNGRSVVGIEAIEDAVPLADAEDQMNRLDPRFPTWWASRRCLKR